jgi:hypothetical protein
MLTARVDHAARIFAIGSALALLPALISAINRGDPVNGYSFPLSIHRYQALPPI